jgi:cobalt-zinc-cadmium efflux system outer membrane protein
MRMLSYISIAVLVVSPACKTYESKPIESLQILRELQALRLESLAPATSGARTTPSLRFDSSDGITSDEAVAAALFLNPGLRAFRKERDVAEGELVAAGLLPNPDLQIAYLFLESFTKGITTSAFDVALNWAPPRPGELAAKEARARARIEEVRAQIATEEWRLASDVRKAHLAAWAAEERLRIFDASLKLRERVRDLVRSKHTLGDANRLDVNLIEIDYADALRDRVSVENERDRARLELNRLLGLPPLASFKLQADGDPLAYRPFKLEPAALEVVMVGSRPALAAARQEYEQAEHALNLACIQRWPWFRFGPAYARDELEGKMQSRFGVGIGIDLPIANQNEGEIAIREAARERLRQAFVAKVHESRAEVNEAYRNLRAQERLIKIFRETIKPALDANAALTEAGFDKGEFSLLQLVTTQDKILKSRREFLDAQLEYWKAVFDLEQALGERFSDAPRSE